MPIRTVPPNWGKSYLAARGEVEYIRVSLEPHAPQSRDFTVYLGDPSQEFTVFNDAPYQFTIGNGGTASVLDVLASIRGTVVHVVCRELMVRGDTSPTEAVPASAQYKYQAHAALGRPHTQIRTQPITHSDAPGLVLNFPLSPYSVRAWFEGMPAGAAIADTTVEQVYRNLGGDTVIWPSIGAMPPDVLSQWAAPRPLDPRTNVLRVTIGAAAVFPGIDFYLCEEIYT